MREHSSPFHEGERFVQERAGQRALAERVGAGIDVCIVPAARSFLEEQELLALAAAEGSGDVWASAWFGPRGFVQTRDDGHTLWIDRGALAALEVDPVAPLLRAGGMLGVLAIELQTRRRLRVNGVVRELDDLSLLLDVQETFANCPKYITKRQLRSSEPRSSPTPAQRDEGRSLDAARVATIRRTDTLFVASQHSERGADASHRGGEPGFVQVLDEQTLRIPDYAGNGMYQTLGNLHSTGRAGLVFLDFEGRRLLHVTGTTRLRLDTSEALVTTGGTGRSWDLRVARWVEGALPASIDAELLERWRSNPG